MDRAEMRRRGIEMPLDARLPSLPNPEADPETSENEAPPVSDADLERAWESGRTEPDEVASGSATPKAAFRPITEAKEAPDVIYVNGKLNDDDDIFADAGEWEGLSDEEAPTAKAAPAKHGDWFAPSSAASPDPAPPAAPEARTPPPHSPRSATPDTPPTRLEGLSSSALPTEMIRSMLSREDETPARRSGAAPKRKRSKKGRGDPDSP
ncbi:hypothetical protein MBRA1_001231 [Malassezia brasiliensis]|uniref:Uncharacterized protein n=1 Tax=Malassezia brasiliensis TaxID=1821822 RepID=A0AAF0DSF6_9BASI|nr:hypothetical protein MBRA1_001231 [Malassezia brasiliensis]